MLLAALCLRAQEGADEHRRRGDQLEARGDFNKAAEEYRAAAMADPSDENLFVLGSHLLRYHGYEGALQTFTYAVGRYPGSPRLAVGLGVAQYSLGRYQEAVETLCRAVDLDPKDPRPLQFIGKMIDVAPGLNGNIEEHLRHFATGYPDNAAAHYFYGLSLLSDAGAEGEAEREFNRALALQPKYPEAHYELGVIYQTGHQDQKAIAQFKAAIAEEPALRPAHYRLAQIYGVEGKTELAKREYRWLRQSGSLAH